MTTTLGRPTALTLPTPAALPGELLDTVTVNDGIAWLDPANLVESYNCLTTRAIATFPCPTPGETKDLSDAPMWIDGVQFAVYGGTTCKGPGYSGSDGRSELTAAFLRQESVGVEQGVMSNLLATAASDDLTPAGGAVTPAVGLALLEGHAASRYNGVPTIHAPRTVGSLLASTGAGINVEGQKFFSKQGSKFASGGGYEPDANLGPDGEAPAAGSMWMYATGEVLIGRGELVEPPAQLDQATNDVLLLVERMYVAAIDCYQAAVLVEVYA